jgi:hypothetical protein
MRLICAIPPSVETKYIGYGDKDVVHRTNLISEHVIHDKNQLSRPILLYFFVELMHQKNGTEIECVGHT